MGKNPVRSLSVNLLHLSQICLPMRGLPVVFLALVTMMLTGCEAIGAIFEAGVWVGVVLVLIVVGVIGFLFSKMKR
ncbi:hypothetical protein BH23BAC4_BH23BAC4_08530 [soil metagenome]